MNCQYFCGHVPFFDKRDFIQKGGEIGLCETLATLFSAPRVLKKQKVPNPANFLDI